MGGGDRWGGVVCVKMGVCLILNFKCIIFTSFDHNAHVVYNIERFEAFRNVKLKVHTIIKFVWVLINIYYISVFIHVYKY